MLQAVILAWLLLGGGITVCATVRYHILLQYSQGESHSSFGEMSWVERTSLSLLYLFILGFIGGISYALLGEVAYISLFVSGALFLCSLFILFAVNAQIRLAVRLRLKTMELMRTVVNAIDMKDAYTKGHSEHVQKLVALLYEHLDGTAKAGIDKSRLMDAALLHDCGKISVRDGVLNKPGRLTIEEWADMKSHPLTGKKMLDDTCFSDISDWVLYHHERMDGKGYFGLEEEDIPLESRMISIADTYSALTTNRIYRPRLSHEEAVEIMIIASDSQFDATLMQSFLKINKRILNNIRP